MFVVLNKVPVNCILRQNLGLAIWMLEIGIGLTEPKPCSFNYSFFKVPILSGSGARQSLNGRKFFRYSKAASVQLPWLAVLKTRPAQMQVQHKRVRKTSVIPTFENHSRRFCTNDRIVLLIDLDIHCKQFSRVF